VNQDLIQAYGDISLDEPVLSVGYVLFRIEDGEKQFLESGNRLINTETSERDIDWTTHRGEYYAAIVATRAALDYTDEPIVVNCDSEPVVDAINERNDHFGEYFQHALYSFLPRFENHYVRYVDRENNKYAHEQASLGLQIGRDIMEDV
jgi:ribonuclease HI